MSLLWYTMLIFASMLLRCTSGGEPEKDNGLDEMALDYVLGFNLEDGLLRQADFAAGKTPQSLEDKRESVSSESREDSPLNGESLSTPQKKKKGKRKKKDQIARAEDKVVAAASEVFFGGVEKDIKEMSDNDVSVNIQLLMQELNLVPDNPTSRFIETVTKKPSSPKEVKPTFRSWTATLSPEQLRVIDGIEELRQEVGEWDPENESRQNPGISAVENDDDLQDHPTFDLSSLISTDDFQPQHVRPKSTTLPDWGIEIDPTIIGIDSDSDEDVEGDEEDQIRAYTPTEGDEDVDHKQQMREIGMALMREPRLLNELRDVLGLASTSAPSQVVSSAFATMELAASLAAAPPATPAAATLPPKADEDVNSVSGLLQKASRLNKEGVLLNSPSSATGEDDKILGDLTQKLGDMCSRMNRNMEIAAEIESETAKLLADLTGTSENNVEENARRKEEL